MERRRSTWCSINEPLSERDRSLASVETPRIIDGVSFQSTLQFFVSPFDSVPARSTLFRFALLWEMDGQKKNNRRSGIAVGQHSGRRSRNNSDTHRHSKGHRALLKTSLPKIQPEIMSRIYWRPPVIAKNPQCHLVLLFHFDFFSSFFFYRDSMIFFSTFYSTGRGALRFFFSNRSH